MARFEVIEDAMAETRTASAHPDILYDLGMMYATGRDCPIDLVAAHKWLNIAAIKGCADAINLRAKVASTMPKADLARALREARDWMTIH